MSSLVVKEERVVSKEQRVILKREMDDKTVTLFFSPVINLPPSFQTLLSSSTFY